MKVTKIIAIVLPLILTLSLIAVVFLWRQDRSQIEEDRAVYQQQVNEALAKWGSEVNVYTVKTSVKPGEQITSDSLTTVVIPSKSDSTAYIKDSSSIIGKYFKIAVTNPTLLTTDMIMDEKLEDDMRSFDLLLTAYSTGLNVGDYIDIYFTAPYGDRYVVLPKVKIRKIQAGGVLTAFLTAAERHIYTGALVDYYLNTSYGATLTGEKYIEPGLQQDAVAYYQVPENISALMQMDPNVSSDALDALNATSAQRNSIEQALMIFRTNEDTVASDADKLQSGRSTTNAAITGITNSELSDGSKAAEQLWNDVSDAAEQLPSTAEQAMSDTPDSATPTESATPQTETSTTPTESSTTETAEAPAQ